LVDTGTKEYAMVKDMLGDGETVELETVEHRLGGARFFDPAHVFATNRGIMIIRSGAFGLHRNYKIIRYESITEVKLDRGPMFCKVHFSLQGEQENDTDKQKWLVGIKYKDALDLIHLVNRMEQKPVQEIGSGSQPQ